MREMARIDNGLSVCRTKKKSSIANNTWIVTRISLTPRTTEVFLPAVAHTDMKQI